ncbi:OmpP1/FadL family transporter [Anianabacter salinae]|uniref:OmpP1/FadL family transporter n=1 Tax=Anianabacter salinae TaxID=2851023 RepID=UPI00225DE51E|nr:transporter [Anianabacter salinae]MBV0912248.1 transporter [Anianabacter salinae]
MKKLALSAAMLAGLSTGAMAGGIDRSGQSVAPLFAETGAGGGFVQLSLGSVEPTANNPAIRDPLTGYTQAGAAIKYRFNDRISVALIADQPFGANVNYANGAPFFGGLANIDSFGLTALGRYEFGNGFSVHGGVRGQSINGQIFTYFGVQPTLLTAGSDFAFGGVAGVAYERPEMALRVALTYSSSITNTLNGTEQVLLAASPTAAPAISRNTSFQVATPQSVNLDFQTGIAPGTLVFGGVRWVNWNGFNVTTPVSGQYVRFTQDTYTYNLGIGRQITDKFAASVAVTYESAGSRPSTTALSPTTGLTSFTVSGSYDVTDSMTFAGGVTYGFPGDQQVPSALGLQSFSGNNVLGIGARISMKF